MNELLKQNTAACIVGAAFIIGVLIISSTFYRLKALDNTLSVTGSTKERVMADTAKWGVDVERIVAEGDLAAGYEGVTADMKKVKQFLLKQGFVETDIATTPIASNEYYTGSGDNQVRKTVVRQTVSVTTKNIAIVETAAQNTITLAQYNIRFTPQQPQYLISNLPDLRVKLIGKAIEDAKRRAESIAGAMGQRVGKMKSANNGVVQVMAPDSTAVSDYGEYDTSTKEKDVMLSVKALFNLK
jgi:hypothetical protein